MVKEITTDEFKEEIFDFSTEKEWKFKGDVPTIIDFHAEWCGPCKTLGPTLEEVEKDLDGQINVIKVNVEEQQELGAIFGIQSIPSLLFIPMEGAPQMAVGALPKDVVYNALNEICGIDNGNVTLEDKGDTSTDTTPEDKGE